MSAAEGFCPGEFSRVAFGAEGGVAFGAAEVEAAGVVADEEDAFGGVDGAGAGGACFDSFGGC